MPVPWMVLAAMSFGHALIGEGKPAEAIAPLKGTSRLGTRAAARALARPGKPLLAEFIALTGDPDSALDLIAEISLKGALKVPNGTFSPRSTGAPSGGENVGGAHIDQRRTAVSGSGRTPCRT
jgi:hypothetical protein